MKKIVLIGVIATSLTCPIALAQDQPTTTPEAPAVTSPEVKTPDDGTSPASPTSGTSSAPLPSETSPAPAADAGKPATTEPAAGATSAAQPATQPETKPAANDPIPSWLKEYAPKQGATTGGASPAPVHPAAATPTPPTAAAKKPVKLYGRLEELYGNGATLPKLNLKAQTPQIDPRVLQGKAQTGPTQLSGKTVASFPADWAGYWSGSLKIHGAQFDKIRWDFDPEEATKEQRLMRPGLSGTVTFTFSYKNNKVTLQPTNLVFNVGTMDQSNSAQVLNKMLGSSGNNQNNPFGAIFNSNMVNAAMQSMPYLVSMQLGGSKGETGLTGNQLNSKLMKNEVRQLDERVVEQNIVTWDNDYNPTTKKMRNSWAESVLRFTRLNANQLYVQAATVNYRQDGKFENKYLLYGTVNRSQAPPSYNSGVPGFPTLPGMPSMQGLPSGGGGFGSLDQLFKQLQGQ